MSRDTKNAFQGNSITNFNNTKYIIIKPLPNLKGKQHKM